MKLKRTLALKMAFIAPGGVVMLFFIAIVERPNTFASQGNVWRFLVQNVFLTWAILMLPLLVTLETSLVGGFEHTDRNWKHLFALPVPRGAIYAGKVTINILLIGLSTFALWAWTMLAGLALRTLRPQLHMDGTAPWGSTLRLHVYSFLAAWLMVAIQTWVSARWQSFAAALGFGISATVAGFVLINADLLGRIYPWTLAMNFAKEQGNPALGLSVGIGGGLIAAVVGGIEFTRRDVA